MGPKHGILFQTSGCSSGEGILCSCSVLSKPVKVNILFIFVCRIQIISQINYWKQLDFRCLTDLKHRNVKHFGVWRDHWHSYYKHVYKFSLLAGKRWFFFKPVWWARALGCMTWPSLSVLKSQPSVIGRLTRPKKFEKLLSWNENPYKTFTL